MAKTALNFKFKIDNRMHYEQFYILFLRCIEMLHVEPSEEKAGFPNLSVQGFNLKQREDTFQETERAKRNFGGTEQQQKETGDHVERKISADSFLEMMSNVCTVKTPNLLVGQITLDPVLGSSFRNSVFSKSSQLSSEVNTVFSSLGNLKNNNRVSLGQIWAILLFIYAKKSQDNPTYSPYFDGLRSKRVIDIIFPEASSENRTKLANFLTQNAEEKTRAGEANEAKAAFDQLHAYHLRLFSEVSYLADALSANTQPKDVSGYRSSDYIAQMVADQKEMNGSDDNSQSIRDAQRQLAKLLHTYQAISTDLSGADAYANWAYTHCQIIQSIESFREEFCGSGFSSSQVELDRISHLRSANSSELYVKSAQARALLVRYQSGQKQITDESNSHAAPTLAAPLLFDVQGASQAAEKEPMGAQPAIEAVSLSAEDRQAMVCAAFSREQWNRVKEVFSIQARQSLTDQDLTRAVAHWVGTHAADKFEILAHAKDIIPDSIFDFRGLQTLVELVDHQYSNDNSSPEQGAVLGECANVFKDKAHFFGDEERSYKPVHLQATTYCYTTEVNGATGLLNKIKNQSTDLHETVRSAVIVQAERLANLYTSADGELILCKLALIFLLLEQGFLNNEDWTLLTNHRNQGMLAWGASQTEQALGQFKNTIVKNHNYNLIFNAQSDDNSIKTQYEDHLSQKLKAYVGEDLSPKKVAAAALRIRQMHACLTKEDFNFGTETVESDALFAEDFIDLGEKLDDIWINLDPIESKQARDEKQELATADELIARLCQIEDYRGIDSEDMRNHTRQVQILLNHLRALKDWPSHSELDQRFKAQQLKFLAKKVDACECEYSRLVGNNPELLDYLQGNAQNRTDEGDLAAQAKLQNMKNFIAESEHLDEKHGGGSLSGTQTFNHAQARSMFDSLQQDLGSYIPGYVLDAKGVQEVKQVLKSLRTELTLCINGLGFVDEPAIDLSFKSSIKELLSKISEINNLDCLKPLDAKYYVYRLEHLRRGIVAWSNQFLGMVSSHEEFFNSSDIMQSLTYQLCAARSKRLDAQEARPQPSIRSSRGSSIASGSGNSSISGGSGSTVNSRGSGASVLSSLGSGSSGNIENQEHKRSAVDFTKGDASTDEMVRALVRSLRTFPSSFGFEHITVSTTGLWGKNYTDTGDLKRALNSQLTCLGGGSHHNFAPFLLGGNPEPGVFYRVYRVLSQFGTSDKDYTQAALVELLSINDGVFWNHAANFFDSAVQGRAKFLNNPTNKKDMLFYLNALHYLVSANAIVTQDSRAKLAQIKNQIKFLSGLTNDRESNGEDIFQSHLGGSSNEYEKYFSVIFSDQSRPSSPQGHQQGFFAPGCGSECLNQQGGSLQPLVGAC